MSSPQLCQVDGPPYRSDSGELPLSYDEGNLLFQVDFMWAVGWALLIQVG